MEIGQAGVSFAMWKRTRRFIPYGNVVGIVTDLLTGIALGLVVHRLHLMGQFQAAI